MADLELEFSTRGELEGARAYAAELEKNIGKMKAAGKDASELTAQFTRLNDAIKESEKALKVESDQQDRTTQSTERVTGSKLRLREAMRGLAVEFPLLARLMGFIANPLSLITAGFALGAGAVNSWVQAIRDASRLQAEAEAIRTTATSLARLSEEIRSSERLEAQTKDLHEWAAAAKSAADSAKALNEELERKRRIDEQLAQERAETLRAEIKAKGLSPADEAAALAQVDAQMARGSASREVETEQSKLANLMGALKQVDELIAKLSTGGTDVQVLAAAKQRVEIAEAEAKAAADKWKKDSVELPEQMRSLEADARILDRTGTLPFWQRYQFKLPFRDRENQGFNFDPRFLVSNPNDIIATRLADARQQMRSSEFTAEDRATQADAARLTVAQMTTEEARRRAGLKSAQSLRESLVGEVEAGRSTVESRTLFFQESVPLGARRGAAQVNAARAEQERREAEERERLVQREFGQLRTATRSIGSEFSGVAKEVLELAEDLKRQNLEMKRELQSVKAQMRANRY